MNGAARGRGLLFAVGLWIATGALAQPVPKAGGAAPDKDAIGPTLQDDRAVIEASNQWLKLLDAGKYGNSWDLAAAQLKSAVTRQQWITGIRDARRPFGKLTSREAEKLARAHVLPGAPDGDYALVIFQSKFVNGKRAEEHLTWWLDDQGTWRVAGYYIR